MKTKPKNLTKNQTELLSKLAERARTEFDEVQILQSRFLMDSADLGAEQAGFIIDAFDMVERLAHATGSTREGAWRLFLAGVRVGDIPTFLLYTPPPADASLADDDVPFG